MEFRRTQMENGLTIVAEVNPSAASMAAGFFARTGSRDESPEVAGVSHFLEHMMFKGTPRRTCLDINREFDELGATYNAFTSEENTVYYAAVLPEYQTRMLDLLCDMLRPALRREDFEMERNVILEEIALYQDQPDYRTYESIMAEHFRGHPLGNGVLGTPQSIRAMKLRDMRAYFELRYSPGNVTVAAVGNLRYEALVEKVRAMCSHWTPHDAPRALSASAGAKTRKTIVDKKLSREHVGLMSAAPDLSREERYAAQILATIVGDSTGSRLYYALVEPALADEASTSYSPMDGAGAFLTFLSVDPERAGRALDIALAELKKFEDAGPTDEELQAAKNKIATGATLKGELPMGRLTAVGFDWVYRGEYVPLADQIRAMLAVAKDQVLDVARRYDLAGATILALGPVESL